MPLTENVSIEPCFGTMLMNACFLLLSFVNSLKLNLKYLFYFKSNTDKKLLINNIASDLMGISEQELFLSH